MNHPLQEKHKPKILHIIGGYPWPLNSGNHLRRYHMMLSLANCGDVDLLAIVRPSTEIPEEIASLCRRVIAFPMNAPKRRTSRDIDLGLILKVIRELGGWPLDERRPKIEAFPADVLEVLNDNYDIVWIDSLTTALILGCKGHNSILDFHDIEHLKIKRKITVSGRGLLRRLRLLIYMRAWRAAEKEALKKFDYVIVCNNEDKEYLAEPKVNVIPNGTAVPQHIQFTPGVPGRILYVGAMYYAPNDDAVQYFITDILPRVRLSCPEAHLVVVGAQPSKQLRDMADGKTVQVLGKVADVAPYLKESALSVVPLRIAGGTRLKILESLAHKKPVVSTTIGAEGLELENGKHILLEDAPLAFADSCIALLRDQALRMRMAEDGYEQVLKKYSWEVIDGHVRDIVESILDRGMKSYLKHS